MVLMRFLLVDLFFGFDVQCSNVMGGNQPQRAKRSPMPAVGLLRRIAVLRCCPRPLAPALIGYIYRPLNSHLNRSAQATHANTDDSDGRPKRLTRAAAAPLALAIVVRQSGQSRHDRALSGALPQLRADPRRADLGQADHRHRPDRLRSEPMQPPSPRTGQTRARRNS